MDKGQDSIFQTVAELHLLRHARLASIEMAGAQEVDDMARSRLREEQRFMLKLAIDPEFYSYCYQRASSDPVLLQRFEELGFVLALALVLPKQDRPIDRRDHDEEQESLYERIVTKAKLAELSQNYPEIFEVESASHASAPASFEALLASSSLSRPEQEGDDSIKIFSEALGQLFPERSAPDTIIDAIARHSALRSIALVDLEELGSFMRTIGDGVDKLVQTLGDKNGVELGVAGDIMAGKGPVELVFRISQGAALLRWFRELSPDEREASLEGSQALLLDDISFQKALAIMTELFGRQASTWERVMGGAEAYRQYGDKPATLLIYQALLSCPEVDDRRKAVAHNRLAVLYRESGRTRKALTEFLEANILWEQLGEGWEEGVSAAFIAEGYHQLGKEKQAQRYLNFAYRTLQACQDGPEQMARGLYYLAGSASTLRDLKMERAALEQGLRYAEPLEDPELFIEFNDRLLRLPPENPLN